MREIVEIPVVWLQGAACSGCVTSLLNSLAPGASSLILRELGPGKHMSLRFMTTVMAGQGSQVAEVLRDETVRDQGNYVFVMEGSVPLADDTFAMVGELAGRDLSCRQSALELASGALAVVAMGTCAAFGGIPSGSPNPTGCVSIGELMHRDGIDSPLINVPGCPPHPDWLVGALVTVARYGLGALETDELGRPLMFFGKNVHETCPRRADFDAGRFAASFGEPGCLYELGCKGPVTFADCPTRMWNSGTNWCIGAGSPCHGCVEPDFPDRLSPFYRKIDEDRLDAFRLLQDAGAAGEQ